jgi:uncharacterized protein (TIGR00290 family)
MSPRSPRSTGQPPLWLWWSSGKDSAWALHRLREAAEFEVVRLVTTVNRVADRVAMHAVRRDLLRAQAASVGVALREVEIPSPCSNEDYEAAAAAVVAEAAGEGVGHMAFGDLFLADVRAYRERMLAGSGIEPVFPIWGLETHALSREMIASGLRATVTCVDPRILSRRFAGRAFDAAFLDDLPAAVDPCGENGEFHSFATAGPMFERPIGVRPGPVVERDGFVFADLLSADPPSC